MSATKSDRPYLGFGNELDSLDSTEFAKSKPTTRPSSEDIKQAAEVTGFRSREAAPAIVKPQQRRRRTGRNVQFNLKTTTETIETFTRIADANGWGLGETFERATALLEAEQAER